VTKEPVSGVADLRQKITRLRQDVAGVLSREHLARLLLSRMRRRYLEEKDPDGVAWPALSPNTKPGPKILVQTGNLLKAVDVMGANRGGYSLATGFGFRIGIKNRRYTERFARGGSRTVDTGVYGRVHQLGNSHVPRRQFIGIGQSDVKSVSELLRRELRKAVQRV